jgi:hypothetical protein
MLNLHAILADGTGFPTVDKERYRYLQAELLLNQAADLLDRGIRDRSEWEDLAVRRFALGVELLEFAKLDQIHAQEIANGVYTLPAKQSQAELNAERKAAEIGSNVQTVLSKADTTFYSDSAIEGQKTAARQAAYAPLVPGWANEAANVGAGGSIYPLPNFISGKTNDTRSNIATQAADVQTDNNLRLAKMLLNSQIVGASLSAETEKAREPGLLAKACWDQKDVDFKRARTQAARDLQTLKVKAAVDPGGALNYTERILPIIQRAKLDFEEAKAKLVAGARGMRLLYGYDDPLPDHSALGPAFFDACLVWVRRSINFMVRFRQLEQNYVLPISVKEQSAQNWESGRASGVWEFDLPVRLLPLMSHVRLRGLSACVFIPERDDDRASLFQAVVSVPRQSNITHLMGHVEQLDQSDIPTCRIGRVAARGNVREPDVVGTSALYNASPIGRWRIELTPKSTTGVTLQKVKDVILDLHLAYRAIPSSSAG